MHQFCGKCDRCKGIAKYPQPSLCHWCNTIHVGDAFNCPETRAAEEERESLGFVDTQIATNVLTRIKELTNYVKENCDMIRAPQETGQGGQNRGSSNGGGSKQPRKNQGYQFIKNDDLSTDKVAVKILDIRENTQQSGENSNRFSDYVLKVNMRGATRRLGLKITNPVFKTLYDSFGPDENNWPGNTFYLFLEEDEFSGQFWMRADVENVKEEKTAPAKKGR